MLSNFIGALSSNSVGAVSSDQIVALDPRAILPQAYHRAGIRADNVTAASIGRVLDRKRGIAILAHLTHANAEQIGLQHACCWNSLVGIKDSGVR